VAHLERKDYIELLNLWFNELFDLFPPESIGDINKSMFANTPLLLSIAYYANKGLEKRVFKDRKQEIQNRMKPLQEIDWSINNPVWKEFKGVTRSGFYFLSNEKVNMENLLKWLQQQGR
jgi:DNA sulfur modification protein DndB